MRIAGQAAGLNDLLRFPCRKAKPIEPKASNERNLSLPEMTHRSNSSCRQHFPFSWAASWQPWLSG